MATVFNFFLPGNLNHKQVKAMRQFAQEYKAWVEQGAASHHLFNGMDGLCILFDDWCYDKGHKSVDRDTIQSTWGGGGYPFGGVRRYSREQSQETMYRNPARLAWAEWAATIEDVPTRRQRMMGWVKNLFTRKG